MRPMTKVERPMWKGKRKNIDTRKLHTAVGIPWHAAIENWEVRVEGHTGPVCGNATYAVVSAAQAGAGRTSGGAEPPAPPIINPHSYSRVMSAAPSTSMIFLVHPGSRMPHPSSCFNTFFMNNDSSRRRHAQGRPPRNDGCWGASPSASGGQDDNPMDADMNTPTQDTGDAPQSEDPDA